MNFLVYSKDNCQYCTMAVALLANEGMNFEVKKLGADFNREELLQIFPNAKTFPQIMLVEDNTSTPMGGYNELINYFRQRDY